MRALRKPLLLSTLVAAALCVTLLAASAGSIADFGQLEGTPAQANYVAWVGPLSRATPPEVLTEDAVNDQAGPDQGYQMQTWAIFPSNFTAPPAEGETFSMVFGADAASTVWSFSAAYAAAEEATDHGTVTGGQSGNCPVMGAATQNGVSRTINWTGKAGKYLVYRSEIPAQGDDTRSNGRYQYVATVNGSGTSHSFTDIVSVGTWHIVVPADANGAIAGCHSGESAAATPQMAFYLPIVRR